MPSPVIPRFHDATFKLLRQSLSPVPPAVPLLKEAPAAIARSRRCSHPTAQSSLKIADKTREGHACANAAMRTEPTEARKPPSLSPAALVFSSPRRTRPWRA